MSLDTDQPPPARGPLAPVSYRLKAHPKHFSEIESLKILM